MVGRGCSIGLVLADARYDSRKNYPFVNQVIGAELMTGFQHNAVLSEYGEAHIERR